MKRLLLIVVSLSAVLPGASVGGRTQSQGQYTYTIVHDLGIVSGSQPFVPSINDAGQVAWAHQGDVFRGDGTTVTPVFAYNRNSPNTAPGRASGPVSISNSGAVAAMGSSVLQGTSVIVATTGGVTIVANPLTSVVGEPVINSDEVVLFSKRPPSSNSYSVQLASGGAVTQIAGPGTVVPGGTLAAAWMPRLNDGGQVAFYGRFPSSATNIFRFEDGTISVIGNGLLGSMNNLGEVAFWQHAYQGIVVGDGGTLRYIAKPSAGLRVDPWIAAINDTGDVAFQVSMTGRPEVAAYVGNAAASWPVIQAGDEVPGLGTVLRVRSGNEALNNSGQVAVIVEYDAPGKFAVIRADPPDTDSDDDGVRDDEDAFPHDPGESRDTDGDGIGDNADADDDQDGQSDAAEAACGSNPIDAGSRSPDADGDGRPDCIDIDGPPVLTVPGALLAEATSPSGAPVGFTVTAEDANGHPLAATCAPASGTVFPLGTTQVSCRAEDSGGRSAEASFSVTVVDGTRPTLFVVTPHPHALIVDEPVNVRVQSNDAVGVAAVTAWANATCSPGFETCSATTAAVSLQLSSGTPQSGTWTGQLTSPLLRRTLPYVLRATVMDAAGNLRSASIFVDNDGIGPHIDRARSDYTIDQSTIWSREFNTGTTAGTIHHETGLLSVDGEPGSGVRVTAQIVTPFLVLPPHGGVCTSSEGKDKQFFLDVTDETVDLTCSGDTLHARAVLARPDIVVRKLLWGLRCDTAWFGDGCQRRRYWVYASLPTDHGIRTGSPFEADVDNAGPLLLDLRRVEDDESEVSVGRIVLDPGEIASPEFVAGPVGGSEALVLTALQGDIEVTVDGVTRTVSDGQTFTIAVRKAEQTITFFPLPDIPFGHAPIALGAEASSGLPVTYTATGACMVQGNSLTMVGVNACVVTASQSGGAFHHAAPAVTQTFLVTHTWSGVLPPLSPGAAAVVALGRTIPVKFTLTGGSAGFERVAAKLYASPANAAVENLATGTNSSDGTFRFDPESREYIFNWDTKGLVPGTWQLRVDLLDGVRRTAVVHLR
jgi:hypothetical protein